MHLLDTDTLSHLHAGHSQVELNLREHSPGEPRHIGD
jgi:hypothetical protein